VLEGIKAQKMEQSKEKVFTRNDKLEERRTLRNESTAAESTFWKAIKGRQIEGIKFRRQHSVGAYIMDFYSPEINLCIELDGEIHNENWSFTHDVSRTTYLNDKGITVLRYSNDVVYKHIEGIIEDIKRFHKEPKLIRGYIKNGISEGGIPL